MKRLFAMFLVLGAVLFMTAQNSSAARIGSDSADPRTPSASSRVHPGSNHGSEGINLKTQCSSDNGDVCTCGSGKLCLASPDGCTCYRPV